MSLPPVHGGFTRPLRGILRSIGARLVDAGRRCRQARACGFFVLLFLSYSQIVSADPAQISCTNQTGPPPTVRAEGIAELVGDLVLSCTGGTPTPAGSPVPLANFQVFLNTNVTSRLIGPLGLSEATLLIDDPSPAAQILCTPQGSPCPATGGANGTPNVFSAVMVASDSLVWRDVPFDPPGAGATRILRFTNVRGNAGPRMVMSIVVTCSQPLVIDKLETIVAVAAPGLVVKVAPTTISQCPINGGSAFGVTIAEGFPAAFRPRNKPDQQTVPRNRNGTESGFYAYGTESGFYAPGLFTATPAVGLADFGTRIRLVFTPVAQGVQLFVPVKVLSGGLSLALVQTRLYGDASGLPFIAPTDTLNGIPVAEVSHQGDQGYAVYQVLSSDPNVVENASIPVTVRFNGNPPSFPPLGAVTVSVSLAPADRPPVSIVTASLQAPLPRFVDTSVPQVAIMFEKCVPDPITVTAGTAMPTVRSEGITELVGDVVLSLTGGFPTQKGAPIPAVDVQIVLNTSVTSRILPAQSGLTEATLLIDEPNSGPAAPPLIPCIANLQATTCPATGTGFGHPSPYFTQPNVFLGGQSASNTIIFKGVPIDPPGPGGTLVLRITNVRANARLTSGAPIMMTVSFTVPQPEPAPPIIVNSTFTVATPQPGLVVADIPTTHLSKCRSLNAGLLQPNGTGKRTFQITVSEGFATSFKTRPYAVVAQNVPGFQYNTESGFFDPNVFPPAGLADSGTGLRVSFRNLDDGTHLFVPLSVPGSLKLKLVKRPGGLLVPGTVKVDGADAAEIIAENGVASAEYEVMSADPNLIETVIIPVAVAYKANIVQSPPGAVTVSVSFAPGLADSAIPRFDDTSKAQDAYVIDSAATCLTCTATAVPQMVRAEGITELVGDLVLRCTGGLPTEKGAPVPAADVLIVLNTSVTSRMLSAPQPGLSEAMLLIGEPNSRPAAPALIPCTANPCPETGPSPYFTQPNVFLGGQSDSTTIVFKGVPIDQPGPGAILVLRITNVRANARQTIGASITMKVSVMVPETEIPPLIVNSTVTVATLQAGLGRVDVTSATLSKCDSLNADLLQPGKTGKSTFQIIVHEGFPTSFKPRKVSGLQNVPGLQYNTESGFYDPSVFPPAGLADCGTVVRLRFQNVGEGAHLFVPSVLQTESATLQLVEEPCGRPVHGSVKVDGVDAAEIIAGNGATSANYQVIAASAALIETVTIPVAVAFQADIGKNLPASGQVQVSVSLAPVGSLTDSIIPRFEDTSKPQDAYAINSGPCPLPQAITCTASAATPLVRAEGIAESAGDFVLTCTGGVPTPAGAPVPLSNVQIFLNTNVTSRIVGSGNNLSEATLMIDEPYPGSDPVPDTTVVAARIPPQVLCMPQGSACPTVGDGFGTPYETIPGTPTVYLGRQTPVGSVSWNDVPIDAPGTGKKRVIRITNVRANASQLGVSTTSGPTEITMSLSVTGSQQVTIDKQITAFIQPGLIVGGNNGSGKQCASQNTPLIAGSDSSPNHNGPNFNITVQEGFASSFKRRNIALTPDGTTLPSPRAQNIPGYPYDTESGFYNTALFTATPVVGLSDFGTRIRITFNNIQSGTTYFVPAVVQLTTSGHPSMPPQPPSPVASGFKQGQMILVQTDQAGNDLPGFTAVAPTGNCGGVGVARVTASGVAGQGYAVYEVVNSDVNAVETATVPVCVAFIANTGANLPGVGKTTLNVTFAPVGGLADPGVPRFADTSKRQDAFAIDPGPCSPEVPPVKALKIERALQLNNILSTITPAAPQNILGAVAAGALEIREILTFNPSANTVTSVLFLVPTGTPFPTPGGIDVLDPPPLGTNIALFTLVPDKTYVTKNSVMFSGTILISSDTWFGNFTGSPAVISFGLTNDTPPKITNVVDSISGVFVAWSASATGTVTFSTVPPAPPGGGMTGALTPANRQQGGSLASIQVAYPKAPIPRFCDNTTPHNAFAINPGGCNPLISLCQGCSFMSDTATNIAAEEYRGIQLDKPGLNRTGLPGGNKGY